MVDTRQPLPPAADLEADPFGGHSLAMILLSDALPASIYYPGENDPRPETGET